MDELKNGVFEQLKNHCDCMDDIREKDVDELVGLISMYTCWRTSPCETFLPEERQEVVELPDCMCDCDVFEFVPYYKPFDNYIDTFSFTLVKQKGVTEESTPITDYYYSDVDKAFRLELPLPDCKCANKCDCGCEATYKLVVTYYAGYEELPDCLIPVFCEALQWVAEKNNCDCEGCQPCKDAVADLQYEIDYENSHSIVDRLADFFLITLTKQYQRNLSLISLCQERDFFTEGFVV